MIPSQDIARLVEIMAALRDPQAGCPWDIEQTHETIVPYTIEETYEVVDAIERNDMVDLREELGDLLLQVVYHSQLADERGDFAFKDVVEAITTKMIRRHPHVFGTESARTSGQAKGAWDRIKSQEKAERRERRTAAGLPPDPSGLLDGVPRALPAMAEAHEVQRTAAKVGFDWSDPAPVITKVTEELNEVRGALAGDGSDVADEIGDLLFAAVNLARHVGIDPEGALRATNAKFRRRFARVEKGLAAEGVELTQAGLDQMERHWRDAKRDERAGTGGPPQSSGS